MRQNSHRRGRWGETFAVLWLWAHGWRVIARSWSGSRHSGAGEIDIIARRMRTLIFVEVKFRKKVEQGTYAMTPHQWRRQQKTVDCFLAAHPELTTTCSWRFDLILISPWHWPQHIAGAWPINHS